MSANLEDTHRSTRRAMIQTVKCGERTVCSSMCHRYATSPFEGLLTRRPKASTGPAYSNKPQIIVFAETEALIAVIFIEKLAAVVSAQTDTHWQGVHILAYSLIPASAPDEQPSWYDQVQIHKRAGPLRLEILFTLLSASTPHHYYCSIH